MATNPYSYGSLGQRWTVGEPTSKSLLDVSRVKADANRWALEQLIVDPDDTANFVLTAPGLNIDSNTLYVDSVNNSVGFGLTNPNDYAFNGTPSWVASGGAGNASVIVVSGTTSIGYLVFADGTTGTDRYSGNIQYNHSTNTMSFRTNGGVEAMSIDSAQDVSLPAGYLKVSGNPSAGTISSNGNGQIGGLTGNGLYMYGKGSTYDLALANANTTVALAIPTGGSATPNVYIPNSLGIGTASPGALMHVSQGGSYPTMTANTHAIVGNTSSGSAISRAAIMAGATTGFSVLDFGDTDASNAGGVTYSHQYDRLNLCAGAGATRASIDSDGLKFGTDTAAANALDDYEEGTWTITDQSGAGVTFTTISNKYTKIGRLVFFALEINSISATGTAQFSLSLPFTALAGSGRYTLNAVTNSTNANLSGYIVGGTSNFVLIESDTSPTTITNASMNGYYLVLTGCYETA